MVLRVLTGVVGHIGLGITTAFLLTKPVTFFELGVIYSLTLGVSFVMEYPSGNLADRYGRKRIYALGVLLFAVHWAFYAGFAHVFLLYLAGAIGGLSNALISGSLEAWLGEEEKRKRPDPALHRVFGLSRSLISIFALLGSLSIGLLLRPQLELIFWTGAAVLTGVGLTALVILPDNRGEGKGTLGFTTGALRVFVRSPALIFLACILAGTYACYSVFVLYWQPQAQVFGVPNQELLLVYSAHLVGVAISAYLYARLARKVRPGYFIHASFACIALSFAFMVFGNSLPYLVACVFSFGLGWGSVFPLFFDWATDIIPSDLRASILSLMTAFATAVAVLATATTGKVIDIWGLEIAVYLGLGLALGILVLLRLVRRLTSSFEADRVQMRIHK